MRWLFLNPNDPMDAAKKKELTRRIDAWWSAFAKKTEDLTGLFSQRIKWDLPAWMERHLQAIHPKLMWEYGPAAKGKGHRLVITPESARHLRPLTAAILDKAPTIPGWEFYGYRLPESVEMAEQTVSARTSGSLEDVGVEVQVGEFHLIDLLYRSPRTSGEDDEQARNDAFVATETLLGEEVLDKWIGGIEVGPLTKRKSSSKLLPLNRLTETVDALIHGIRDQLSGLPHSEWVDDTEWSGIELKPEEVDDYPRCDDLLVAITGNLPLWQAAHRGVGFFSGRFTRCGETFCYVKLDGSEGLEGSQFEDRASIEEALDEALKKTRAGAAIGGGTGLRYSYVDLALADLRGGIEIVRRVLQKGRIPNRSWVLFFDADLVAEWVGIYDDTPPPPEEQSEEE